MRDPAFDPPQEPYEAPPRDPNATPSMAQYIEIKAANPDCLLFYRMGDFYELFFRDAEIASRTLGIVLTKRGKHAGEDIPMCGVPVTRSDEYLHRLIAAGHRVAICEQLEDPAEARKRGSKAVVRRDVVRIVTPGTITEEGLLDARRASLLTAIARQKAGDEQWDYALAAVDLSTGEIVAGRVGEADLAGEIARLDPREMLVPDALLEEKNLSILWHNPGFAITRQARDGFDPASAERRLLDYFGVATLDAFGGFSRPEVAALGALIAYVDRTQLGQRAPLMAPRRRASAETMAIDAATRLNLELTRTLAGERAGSLLATIDRTVTAAGGRLLAQWLGAPVLSLAVIEARQEAIGFLIENSDRRRALRASLGEAPDLLRSLTRLALDRAGPRDLQAIARAILAAEELASALPAEVPALIADAREALARAPGALGRRVMAGLAEDLPLVRRDGGFIRPGFDPELDECLALKTDSRVVIAGLETRYREEIDARTLRIKHNNQLGYFIEVPQAVGERLLQPPHQGQFVHRQTMAGAMRFTTTELGGLERKILEASDRALKCELRHFEAFAAALLAEEKPLRRVAEALAQLDCLASLAELADRENYTRPLITEGLDFEIAGGRHPVVEAALRKAGESFIANPCDLSGSEKGGRILLVTGANMAGKSTYLRQNALIAILAQMGSFVPAQSARIGLVDRLFSRVGAADDLARGRSTFMVEMVETAAILNQSGPRALVILDEIGRGTATYDGLSIAWAAIEHLHEQNRCRALFATHFHELTALGSRLPRLAPVTMKVTTFKGDVIFLHEVIPGAADRSYGIQVAKLAGLPTSVVARAGSILAELEKADRAHPRLASPDDLPLFRVAESAPPPFQAGADPVHEALRMLDPDEMSPREAQEALYRLKAMLSGK
ncbi:MAG: DNA mismatch repair protein MutS [Beijerinckiaceae bacterium]|nr:DNA mismatch repair protein MutS [Beijerinckiaceae bacterium]